MYFQIPNGHNLRTSVVISSTVNDAKKFKGILTSYLRRKLAATPRFRQQKCMLCLDIEKYPRSTDGPPSSESIS